MHNVECCTFPNRRLLLCMFTCPLPVKLLLVVKQSNDWMILLLKTYLHITLAKISITHCTENWVWLIQYLQLCTVGNTVAVGCGHCTLRDTVLSFHLMYNEHTAYALDCGREGCVQSGLLVNSVLMFKCGFPYSRYFSKCSPTYSISN